jgi:hypothetical protein
VPLLLTLFIHPTERRGYPLGPLYHSPEESAAKVFSVGGEEYLQNILTSVINLQQLFIFAGRKLFATSRGMFLGET